MSQQIGLNTTNANIRAIPDFIGGILKICNNMQNIYVKNFEKEISENFDNLIKNLLRELIAQKIPKNDICAQLGISERVFNRLYEEICDDDLIKETEARIEEAGGWDEMRKDSISREELLKLWDITEEDLKDCEDYD
ncbi:MAG: hypothetical protein LBM87_07105 [Ruminococcus sp.]|jgi:hypothetical protein|nr:hypothetical protein [Ruminococcus sp.]